MSAGTRRAIRAAGAIALGALLVAFGRRVDWTAVVGAMRLADPVLLAAALVLNLLSLALKGVRWWVFLRPLGVRSLSLVLRATFAGASLNNLLVAQGGEGARVLLVSRASGVPSARVLAALALERLLDAACYLALLGGAAWLVQLPPAIARWRGVATGALVVGAVIAVTLGLVSQRRGARAGDPGDAPAGGGVRTYLRRFTASVAEVASLPRLGAATLLSLAAWGLQVGTYHLVARAAHLPLPLAGSIAAVLAVGVSFLLRATPGNVGVFQVAYALTVSPLGVAEGPAIAVALLIQAVQVLPVLVIGSLVAPRLVTAVRSRPATPPPTSRSSETHPRRNR
jgi:uncharacterized membrane protein YbhN (UPF0104 family)